MTTYSSRDSVRRVTEDQIAAPTIPHVEVTRRLLGEFGNVLPLHLVAATVRECGHDLDGDGAPHPALPELLERLARQRLRDRLADTTADTAGRAPGPAHPP